MGQAAAKTWAVTIGGRYIGQVLAEDRSEALALAREFLRSRGWNTRRISFHVDVQITGPEVA